MLRLVANMSAPARLKQLTRFTTASTKKGDGGGGGLLLGAGVVGVIGGCTAIAYNPDAARKKAPVLDPFISSIEKATSSMRPPPVAVPSAVQGSTKDPIAPVTTKESEAPAAAVPGSSVVESKEDQAADLKVGSRTLLVPKEAKVAEKTEEKTVAVEAGNESHRKEACETQTAENDSSKTAMAQDGEEADAALEQSESTENSSTNAVSGMPLDGDALRDLDSLDRASLLYRVASLTKEVKERAKWEALRQHDMWRRAEQTAWAEYADAIAEQRAALLARHEAEVAGAQAAAEVAMAEALNARELVIAAEDERSLALERERVAALMAMRLAEKESQLEADTAEARGVSVARSAGEAVKASSARRLGLENLAAETESLASLLTQDLADTSTETVSAHRSAAKALAGYMASPKAPTLLELKRDFRAAYVAGVKASMVPEGLAGSSAGRFVGSVLGGFHLATPPLLQKEDTEQEAGESGDAASVLRAAKRRVDQDDVPAALSLLSQLQGPARTAMGDWMSDAGKRVAQNEALAALAKI